MARELAGNVLVFDKDGERVVLLKGKPVPSEYADQVGDHCYADAKAAEDDGEGNGSAEAAKSRRGRQA